jgi:UDP-N-acetylmuramate dehydrogenase
MMYQYNGSFERSGMVFQIEELSDIVGKENVLCGELLSRHTTFHIGGEAKYFVCPSYIEDFTEAVCYLRREKQKHFIMGNGSNLLAKDEGYDGVVLTTHMPNRKIEACENKTAIDACLIMPPEDEKRKEFLDREMQKELSKKTLVFAGSGIMLSSLANIIGKKGLTGFEFASGIPGTLGGAVAMNAGAYGGEIKDCIVGAMLLTTEGTKCYYTREELELGYRSSRMQKEDLIVLWALFAFDEGEVRVIEQTMRELNQKRREKQPLQYGSAGSTFKRPEGHFAGKLIEDAGLKGYRVGDVMVSDKHCGFVVNVGEGTYEQAQQVIAHVQKTVQERFGVWLETEVKRME